MSFGSFALRSGVGQSRLRKFLTHFDWGLFVVVLLLAGVGLLNLYSAVHETAHSVKFEQQLVWVVVGFLCFFALTSVDYHAMHRLVWIGIGIIIFGLMAVRIFSDPLNGAARWLQIGGLRVQPSELAKLALILAMARLINDGRNSEARASDTVPLLAAIVIPVALVAMQPDLGTASLLVLIVISMSLLMVENLWPLAGVLFAGIASLPALWDHMHDYQKSRVLAFLDPSADPTGSGWHAQQSIYAVGSGRVTGKGYLGATQNSFNFLPEHWTDFPFSVWAEEWGFVGSLLMLILFAVVIFWCVQVALNARDRFGSAICVGVAAMLFWHVIVNISMVLGMAPVVGVTLPLISYGGSSVITFFVGLGLVSSVSMRRHGY